MKIKSNPYVFPFTPFFDLDKKTFFLKKVGEKEIDFNEIKRLLNKTIKLLIKPQGESLEEKIFSLFLNPEIRFGEESYILSLKNFWLEKIKFFTKQNKPLEFSILGFPFKVPVPLKTNRVLPDLGEIIALKRLVDILLLIKHFYPPGGIVHIVTEEAFYKFNNMKKNEVLSYQDFLKEIVKKMGWKNFIKFMSLDEMETLTDNFDGLFQQKKDHFVNLYITWDKKFIERYHGAHSSIYYIVNTQRYNLTENELMDVYNKKKNTNRKKILLVRRFIENNAHSMTIEYLAYLELRDELGFFKKKLPDAIQLSVSPKKYRLGIIPLGKNIIRLPYHGVPVFDKVKNRFTIEYLIDLKRKKWQVTEVYLKDDKEKKPFFYIKEK